MAYVITFVVCSRMNWVSVNCFIDALIETIHQSSNLTNYFLEIFSVMPPTIQLMNAHWCSP